MSCWFDFSYAASLHSALYASFSASLPFLRFLVLSGLTRWFLVNAIPVLAMAKGKKKKKGDRTAGTDNSRLRIGSSRSNTARPSQTDRSNQDEGRRSLRPSPASRTNQGEISSSIPLSPTLCPSSLDSRFRGAFLALLRAVLALLVGGFLGCCCFFSASFPWLSWFIPSWCSFSFLSPTC